MIDTIGLINYEVKEFCSLNRKTGCVKYYTEREEAPEVLGMYFRNEDIFFALYPSEEGPRLFFENREYSISRDLTITLDRQSPRRRFCIVEYGIQIEYDKSPYIEWDTWSEEKYVDLFFRIEQDYMDSSFYEIFTLERVE